MTPRLFGVALISVVKFYNIDSRTAFYEDTGSGFEELDQKPGSQVMHQLDRKRDFYVTGTGERLGWRSMAPVDRGTVAQVVEPPSKVQSGATLPTDVGSKHTVA